MFKKERKKEHQGETSSKNGSQGEIITKCDQSQTVFRSFSFFENNFLAVGLPHPTSPNSQNASKQRGWNSGTVQVTTKRRLKIALQMKGNIQKKAFSWNFTTP